MDLKKYPEYDKIPFEVIDITKRLKTVGGRKVSVTDETTGEVFEGREIKNEVEVWKDNASYIKMFPSGLHLLHTLSTKGVTLLVWRLKRLKVGQFEIELRVSVVVRDHKNLAGGRFYQAVEELLRYGYMVRKKGSRGEYFINPNFFFNGDRKWINK